MILIMGPSGAGKSTIMNSLVEKGFEPCVTYTTRKPRKGEINGKDYKNFLSL